MRGRAAEIQEPVRLTPKPRGRPRRFLQVGAVVMGRADPHRRSEPRPTRPTPAWPVFGSKPRRVMPGPCRASRRSGTREAALASSLHRQTGIMTRGGQMQDVMGLLATIAVL